MTIVELGRTVPIDDLTTPTRPMIRRIPLGNIDVDAALLSVFSGLEVSDRPIINIAGVRDLNGAVFVLRSTIGDMEDVQQSYYWAFGTQTLYIHLPPSDNPFTSVYLYGVAQGFSDTRPVYIDGISYLPLVSDTPSIRQQQDLENYGKLSFITGTVRLDNVDGRLDDLKDKPVYGNDIIIYNLNDQNDIRDDYTVDELTRLATLFVEDYDISLEEVSLRVQDRRKSQNQSVPNARFNSTDYPDADPELYGTVVPVLWGTAREIPTVITNGTLETGNVKHRAALLLTGLGTVSVKDGETWVNVTSSVVNTNLATGEFEIPAAQGRDSDGTPLPAKLSSPTGIAITRLTDIIVDATERFTGAEFNSSNYDLDEWAVEASAVATGAYYLDEEKKLFELIQDIQSGANVGFRYEIKPDGRRTVRVDDESRVQVTRVPNVLLENRSTMSVATDSTNLVAEVVVAYSRSYESGRYLRVTDDSSAQEVLETYAQRPRKEYKTLLTNETHAQQRAAYVRARFDDVRGIGEFVLMGEQYLGLRVYDIIEVEITPDDPGVERRPFYGIWRCKVLSIDADTQRTYNRITAVLISQGAEIDGGDASTAEYLSDIDGGDATSTYADEVDGGDVLSDYL